MKMGKRIEPQKGKNIGGTKLHQSDIDLTVMDEELTNFGLIAIDKLLIQEN